MSNMKVIQKQNIAWSMKTSFKSNYRDYGLLENTDFFIIIFVIILALGLSSVRYFIKGTLGICKQTNYHCE